MDAVHDVIEFAFAEWCETVSKTLDLYAGCGLPELDVPEWKLRVWWQAGVPSRIVASALTTQVRRIRWSLPVELQLVELQRLRVAFQKRRRAS